ncbi:MAG TPA: FAD-dependent oxidoreductase [Hyphomicrobiaceae bacterium]|nr:FAD-dependent oxidoreductase [Hyphomicrobiaceae bacterium]
MPEYPGTTSIRTRCCIVGGGPAGMMLGLLLARAGLDVEVLEKHADFLRDFRGDTIHPSTLEVMHELGLLAEFLRRPHQRIQHLVAFIGDTPIRIADFGHVPTHCRFIALMPQWDFLDFIAQHAQRYATFHLRMQTAATGLLEESGRIVGVSAEGPGGTLAIHADLIVAADGRDSRLRDQAGLRSKDLGAPIDVFWLRLSKQASDPSQALGRIGAGALLAMLDRGDYWQCAYVIAKGEAEAIRGQGIAAFRDRVAAVAPILRDRLTELKDWQDVKLLSVAVNRLMTWARPGLLCIGDAAHAMSPIGGVGINLAIQDAVAAANLLAEPLRKGRLTLRNLEAVQERRMFPTRATQWLQVQVQNRFLSRVLASRTAPRPALPVRVLGSCPYLQRLPARLIGVGIRPEHVRTPQLLAPK